MKTIIPVIFLIILISCISTPDKVIGIQSLGRFDKSLIDTIQNTIEDIYGFNVKTMSDKKIPKSAFVNVKSPRYRADSLIRFLRREKPSDIDYVIGLTEKDISTTKRDVNGQIKLPEYKYSDWGIFGLGFRPGPSCVVSTYRLKIADKAKFIERLKKICIHELGHNLGLKHCDNDEKCVMRDAAETIRTIDQVDLKLCNNCKLLIN